MTERVIIIRGSHSYLGEVMLMLAKKNINRSYLYLENDGASQPKPQTPIRHPHDVTVKPETLAKLRTMILEGLPNVRIYKRLPMSSRQARELTTEVRAQIKAEKREASVISYKPVNPLPEFIYDEIIEEADFLDWFKLNDLNHVKERHNLDRKSFERVIDTLVRSGQIVQKSNSYRKAAI